MNRRKMLTKVLIITSICLLSLLGVGVKVYFEVNRTPRERAEAREHVETYLQKRFAERMVIEDEETRYNFKIPGSGFVFVVHPEGNPDFAIRVYQMKRGSPDFMDDYYDKVWKTTVEAKVQTFLQATYIVETQNEANFGEEAPNFSQFPQWGITSAPSLQDFKDKVLGYGLSIKVSAPINEDYLDKEYGKMYHVIQFLKESGLAPADLLYEYGSPDDQGYFFYHFHQDDFENITSVQTMITILESDN